MGEAAKQFGPEYVKIDHPWVSHQHVPIYEYTIPTDATDEELDAFLRARDEWAKRAQYPVAWLADLSNITKSTARQRRVFAEHLKGFQEHAAQWNGGSALIAPSGWLRGLVTAVFWIWPPQFAYKVFAKRADALEWAQMRLDAKIAECRARSQVQAPQ